MVGEEGDNYQVTTRQKISKPPLNLLFNPSLIVKDDVWKIDIVRLLEILLSTLTTSKYKDLRLCGVAILTSTLIHRLKVESIFRLEKIASKQQYNDGTGLKEENEKIPIPEISNLSLPFRKEVTYPISLEELLSILENMVTDLTKPVIKKSQVSLEPVEVVNFQDYLIKFERIIEEFEMKLLTNLKINNRISFNELVKGLDSLEASRYFIAMLYLCMKNKIDIVTEPARKIQQNLVPDSINSKFKYQDSNVEYEQIIVTLKSTVS
jgi:segregation and condensation protein A